MFKKAIIWIWVCVSLAACNSIAPQPPTLTPTREMSGPTIQPSATVLNLIPTEAPPDYVGLGQTIPEAAAVPFGGEIRPLELTPSMDELRLGLQPVLITLSDGRVVTGDLYQNAPVQLEQGLMQQRLPAVLLVGASREAWETFPSDLRDAGYTVLVVDLGAEATSQDFVLALRSLSEADTVNPGLMAVIGIEASADLALIGCAEDLLCDALVLISPMGRDTLANVIAGYNPRPLMVAVGQADTESYQTALALQASASGSFSLQAYEGILRGYEIIRLQPDFIGVVQEWLARFII